VRAAATNGAVRLACWSAFLVVTLRLLRGPAFGELAVPLGSLDALDTWADRTSPAVMALAVVRLAALAATWYLVAATVLAVAADMIGWRPLRRLAGAVSPPLVRHIATRSAGAGLAAGALLAGTPLPPPLSAALSFTPASAADRPTTAMETATTQLLAPVPEAPASGTATMTRGPVPPPASHLVAAPIAAGPAARETATMTRTNQALGATATDPAAAPPAIPRAEAGPGAEPGPGAAAGPAARAGAGTGSPGETATMTRRSAAPTAETSTHDADSGPDADASAAGPQEAWIVELGDSFWSIAEDVLGATVGDAVVDRYWRRLVAANRDGLLDPGNPDLLVPGQRLLLPPPG